MKRIIIAILAIPLISPIQTAYAGAVLICELNTTLYACEDTCAAATGGAAASRVGSSTTSGGDGGSCGDMEAGSQANKDQVWGYFVNKFMQAGYTKDEAERATAGIMGNWEQESGFSPDRHNQPDPGQGCGGAEGPISGIRGLGIAQWCGDRQQKLADYASGKGSDISCLGTQLEFTWIEMEERNLIEQMKGLSPAESSQIFDEKFEVSNGTGERQKKGEAMYTAYTGKDPGKLTTSSNSGKSCTSTAASSSGAIPGETCAEAQPAINEAIASGKVILGGGDSEKADIEKCSDSQLPNCSGGTRGKTQRGIMAGANSSGTTSLTITSLNEDHDCDSGDHPNGLATDIGAVNGERCDTQSAACDALFKYYIEHAEELDIRWIIYNGPGCQAAVAGHENISECRGDHSDHIHVSYNE